MIEIPSRPSGTEPRRSWSELMAAAQRGDRAAYDRLLRDIMPTIRAVAARHHRQRDQIEEVTQDVLLTIHRVRHTYDPDRPFEHWLAAIARARSIDALRRRYRHAAIEVDGEAASFAYEACSDPIASRIEAEYACRDELDKAITALPALQREALRLVKLREMSLAEAAQLTGRSKSALKVAVHRAVKSLQVQLAAY